MKTELVIPVLRKRPHAPGAISHASPAERLAHRAEMCAEIAVLLQAGPMTARDISDRLGLHPSTGQSYLRYMTSGLRSVRKTDLVGKYGRSTWELGEDSTLPTPDEMLDRAIAPRRKVAPARQIGMPRDHLVTALFGPAQQPQ